MTIYLFGLKYFELQIHCIYLRNYKQFVYIKYGRFIKNKVKKNEK